MVTTDTAGMLTTATIVDFISDHTVLACQFIEPMVKIALEAAICGLV
jgi:hypothetical protein